MTRSLVRTAAVALATMALAAPTALARPDVTPAAPKPVAPAHVHGFATRPIIDRNPVAPSSAPVTVSVASDRGIDWASIGIGIAGSLLAVSVIAAVAAHGRQHRVAA
jgi:hypothetical protein